MDRTETVRAFALQAVGSPYLYGGTGRTCCKAYRESIMRQYPQYAGKVQ